MSESQSALQLFLAKTRIPASPVLVSRFEDLAKNLLQRTDLAEAYGAGRDVLLSVDKIKQDQATAVQVIGGVCLAFNGSAQLPQDTARLLLVAVGETLVAAIDSNDQDFRKSALALSQRIRVSPLV